MEDKKMLEIFEAFDLFVTGLSLSNVKDINYYKKKVFKDVADRHDLVCSFELDKLNHYIDIALYDNDGAFDKLNVNFSVPKKVEESVLDDLRDAASSNKSFCIEQFGSVYNVEVRNVTDVKCIKEILNILATKAYGNN